MEEIMEETRTQKERSRFVVEEGKTFLIEDGQKSLFGDFGLKLRGELQCSKKEKHGFWVASCTTHTRGHNNNNLIVLPVNAFDSRGRLLQELRGRLGGGLVNLSGTATASTLADYLAFLKDDLAKTGDLTKPPEYYKAYHYGFQYNGYWLLNKDLHVFQNAIVPPQERAYFLEDEEVSEFASVLDQHLLDGEILQSVCKRYIDLSKNFGCNAIPFQLATSFLLTSLIKAVITQTVATMEFSDESSIGVIYSQSRNVGKSLTLKLLAKGQGVCSKPHPLLCSGGDQNISGVSLKVLLGGLSCTQLTTLVDDPTLAAPMCEFLLQLQGGLPQGSLRTGLSQPLGSIMLSTNSKANERLEGRCISFVFSKDTKFTIENEKELQELSKLLDKNKGFLVAWVMRFFRTWLHINQGMESEAGVNAVRNCLQNAVAGQQDRWYKGCARVIFTYLVFHEVAGTVPDLSGAIKHIVKHTNAESDETESFWTDLQKEINCALEDHEKPVLTWLHPDVNVLVQEKKFPAIGISVQAMNGFTSISNVALKRQLAKVIDCKGTTYLTSSMPFALNKTDTLEDMKKKRPNQHKKCKGYRIPKNILKSELLNKIEYVCGVKAEKPDKEVDFTSEKCHVDDKFLEEIDSLQKTWEELIDQSKQRGGESSSDEDEDTMEQNDVINELSPFSKSKYNLMTPRKKLYFRQGVLAGVRLASGISEIGNKKINKQTMFRKLQCLEKQGEVTGTQIPAVVNNPEKEITASATETPAVHSEQEITRASLNGEDNTSNRPKRKLSYGDVEGTIGVRKRVRATNKETSCSKQSSSDEVCKICQSTTPKKSKEQHPKWVCCDKCEHWFHLYCLQLKNVPKKKEWLCKDCRK